MNESQRASAKNEISGQCKTLLLRALLGSVLVVCYVWAISFVFILGFIILIRGFLIDVNE